MGTKKELAAAIVAISMSTLAACGAVTPAVGELGDNQKVLAACPDQKLASMINVDVSGTGRDDAIAAGHLKAISFVVRKTAICGGHLRVTAFAGTSAVTREVFDGELQLAGATDIARLRRAPALVDETMSTITTGYQAALGAPTPGDGSDITGQYRLAGEYASQLGSGYRLEYFLLTDGFQNTGVGVVNRVLSADTVTVAGLGKVAGPPPNSDIVEGLVRFYDAICARTEAAECRSVTDFTVGR